MTTVGSRDATVVVSVPVVRISKWKCGDIVYGEVVPPRVVTANFSISLLNIGQATAKDVVTEWTIVDNGHRIKSPSEWLDEIGKPRWSPVELKQGHSVQFQYGPHISAGGQGTLNLTLVIMYTDASSGRSIRKEQQFFIDYTLRGERESKQFVLSPVLPSSDTN